MNLLKTTALTALSTGIKILAGLAGNKVIALYLGPAGLAQIGQFANFTSILAAISGGGVTVGVTKYIAEYRARQQDLAPLLGTALAVTLMFSLIVALVVMWSGQELSRWLTGSTAYHSLMPVVACALVFMALHGLLAAMLNGYKQVRLLVAFNILSSVAGVLALALLTIYWGLHGALLALLLTPVSVFLLALAYAGLRAGRRLIALLGRPDRASLKKLARFTAMAMVSAITLPLALLVIRDHLGQTISWQAAGYWQGVWKISEAYLLLVTTSLGVYYLPRLSEIQEAAALRREILQGYKILLPLVAVSAIAIYLAREWITRLLFSADFMPMTELFAFQLLGDFLKIGAWLLAYLMLAKVMPGTFIVTEIAFSLCFTGLALWLTGQFGLVGVSYAFALSYLLYWLALALLLRGHWRHAAPCPERA